MIIERNGLVRPAWDRLVVERQCDAALDTYLRELGVYAQMSASIEADLARRTGLGDRRAREQLVTRNLWLVVAVASHYAGNGVPLLDLIQEGTLGLIRAVDGYDLTAGTRLVTYAVPWIRQTISHAMASADLIRVPTYLHVERLRVERIEGDARAQGQRLSDAEIARAAKVKPSHLASVRHAQSQGVVSLDAEIAGKGEDALTVYDVTPAPAPDPQDVRRDAAITRMLAALDALLPLERRVLDLRYGLTCAEPQRLLMPRGKIADQLAAEGLHPTVAARATIAKWEFAALAHLARALGVRPHAIHQPQPQRATRAAGTMYLLADLAAVV